MATAINEASHGTEPEHLIHDPAWQAPEVDHSAVTPQVAYSSSPEFSEEKAEKEIIYWKRRKRPPISDASPRAHRRKTLIVVAITVLAILIGLGVGLAVGLTRSSNEMGSRMASESAGLAHGILNDSSFAALSTSETQHIFFQDINGMLRQATCIQNAPSWNTSTALIIPETSNARNLTPITAFGYYDEIFLFYADTTNAIRTRWFSNGAWQSTEDLQFITFSGAYTTTEARSLSVSPFLPDERQFLLLVEGINGLITAFHGDENVTSSDLYGEPSVGPNPPWIWKNITNELANATTDGFMYAPFSSSPSTSYLGDGIYPNYVQIAASGSGEGLGGYTSIYDPSTDQFQPGISHIGPPTICNNSSRCTDFPGQNHIDLAQAVRYNLGNPVASYNFFVNTTNMLDLITQGTAAGTTLNVKFPYPRIAANSQNGSSSSIYIYHQINETTFGEHIWSPLNSWQSYEINIGVS